MRGSRIFSALLAVAAAGALAAGCGGGEDRDPREILEAALSEANQPRSGVVDISGDLTAEGEQGGSFTVKLNGPFQLAEDGTLDRASLDAELSGQVPGAGGGLTLNAGLAVAGDKAYVTWQDQAYELDESSAKELAPDGAPSLDEADEFTEEDRQRILDALTNRQRILDALTNLKEEGTEEIDGVETTHISAEVDLLEELEKESEELEDSDLDLKELREQVELDPLTLDFYVDDNDVLRRVEVSLAGRPAEGVDAQGVDSVSANFTVSLSEVNEEQTIEVPRKAKPIHELFDNLGLGIPGFNLNTSIGAPAVASVGPDGSVSFEAAEESKKAAEEAVRKGSLAAAKARKAARQIMLQNKRLRKCLEEAAGDPQAVSECMP